MRRSASHLGSASVLHAAGNGQSASEAKRHEFLDHFGMLALELLKQLFRLGEVAGVKPPSQPRDAFAHHVERTEKCFAVVHRTTAGTVNGAVKGSPVSLSAASNSHQSLYSSGYP